MIYRAFRSLGSIALTIGVVLAWQGSAFAHAVPESANPPIDGVVAVAPAAVEVTFSEEVVPEGTLLEVFTLAGERVDAGDSSVDLQDPERRRATVSLVDGIAPGAFLVQWTSESAIDEDIVSGSFRFMFDPSATPDAAMAASPPSDRSATPAPMPTPPDTEGDSGGFAAEVLFGLGALVIAGAFGLIIWRGRLVSDSGTDGGKR